MQTLWVSKDGEITCHAHAGHYLKSAIANKPLLKNHKTPLTTWKLLKVDFPCEDCGK